MKKLLIVIAVLISFAVQSQTTPNPTGTAPNLTYTWTANQTRTTNGAYVIGPLSGNYAWSIQYVGNKLAGRGVHDSITYRVMGSADGVVYQLCQGYSVVKKSAADTVTMENKWGTALKYLKFEQRFHATDTTKQEQMIWTLKQK